LSDSFLNVNGLKIRYWTNGKRGKSTVVLLHGNAFSLDNWKATGTLDALSALDCALFAIDLPVGKGSKSDKIREKDFNSYSDVVSWLEQIFEALLIDPNTPLALIGPSLGGGVATSYAIKHPDRVGALVLVAPAFGHLGHERDTVSELAMPILLIWGDKDDIFPSEQYARPLKQELRNSRLIILKDAGHAAYLAKPTEFNELVSDFLSDVL
jgi:pimeloyl-ACP methyl ester carboxylesterase